MWPINRAPTNFMRNVDGTLCVTVSGGNRYATIGQVDSHYSGIWYDGVVIIEDLILEGHDIAHPIVPYSHYSTQTHLPSLMVALDSNNDVKVPLELCLNGDNMLLPTHSVGCCGNTLLEYSSNDNDVYGIGNVDPEDPSSLIIATSKPSESYLGNRSFEVVSVSDPVVPDLHDEHMMDDPSTCECSERSDNESTDEIDLEWNDV